MTIREETIYQITAGRVENDSTVMFDGIQTEGGKRVLNRTEKSTLIVDEEFTKRYIEGREKLGMLQQFAFDWVYPRKAVSKKNYSHL